MACFQTALDVLESVKPEWKSSLFRDLKVLLRLLRTFYLCGKKWGKGSARCESTFLSIQDTVSQHVLKIQSICLGSGDVHDEVMMLTCDLAKLDHLSKGISAFLASIHQSFWQEMEELYQVFVDGAWQSSCSSSSEDMEIILDIMESLLHNASDILQYKNCKQFYGYRIQELEESVRFLKNFVLFAAINQGLKHSQTEYLLAHIAMLIVDAARLFFTIWCSRSVGESNSNDDIYPLIWRILPVEHSVCGIYVRVLQEASKLSVGLSPSSHSHTPENHRTVSVDFVDSLLFLLWKLLSSDQLHIDIFDHQPQNLYGGLTFLRTILKEHQNIWDEQYEKMHDLIRVLICEAGTIICLFFVEENEGGLLELLFSDLEETFKLIEEQEATHKYQLMSSSYFPLTNLQGFIDSVLEKLKSASLCKVDSVALMKDKFQIIHDGLAFLRTILADVMESCNQHAKLLALSNLIAAVAYETEFAIDSLGVGITLQSLVVLLNSIVEEIKLIKAEVSETVFTKRLITKVQDSAKPYSKIPLTANELVVSLGDESQKIIDRLTRGTEQLDIVSIVGMPGLGKTTLAKKVYSNDSIVHHFQVRSWCCVTQIYNKKRLLLEILGVIGLDLDEDADDLDNKLRKYLKGKRFLIVLDDIWDTAAWNILRNSFPDDSKGSRILLTSRHYDVASQIKPNRKPHNLRTLTKCESLDLLQKRLCSEKECPPALLTHGKAIAEDCKGLPLMIVIVAGVLSNIEPHAWEKIAKSLRKGTLSVSEQCKETLQLSYLHLPNHLKPCFLYFGTFKEDQQIRVQELFQLWIAEGFVKKRETECLEDVAEGYLMELIQRNLIMVSNKGSTGKVKFCVVHDLLLDFCKAKSKEEHFMHFLHGNEPGTSIEPSTSTPYRLLVQYKRVQDFEESRLICPWTRTLLVSTDYLRRHFLEDRFWYDIFYKFWKCILLSVLDLRGIHVGPFFPRELEVFVHLRYLALAFACNVTTKFTIPSSIDNLCNLEVFLVEGKHIYVSLPDTIWNMKALRYLRTTSILAFWELQPKENHKCCSSLQNLTTLSAVEFSCIHTMNEVMKLIPNIRRLRCWLQKAGAYTENVCRIVTLDFMNQLHSLSLHSHPMEFHNLHFQFPQNLKKLVLSNFWFPWSNISPIEKLPHLEVLKLLNNAFAREDWEMDEGGTFPKLRLLRLERLHSLTSWTASEDNFPSLEKLILHSCSSLKDLPSGLPYISSLQMIEMNSCPQAHDSIKKIEEERMNIGNDYLKISSPAIL